MPKKWNDWKSYWDNEEDWMYAYDEEKPYKKDLKKIAVAGAVFIVFYAIQAFHNPTGEVLKEYTRNVLEWKMDFKEITQGVQQHLPSIDSDILKHAQAVIARPTNPYQYMNIPVEGEIVSNFGWKDDEKGKPQYWQDGIEYKVPFGTKIKASSTGKVKSIAQTEERGKMVVLSHANEIETVYGYLEDVKVSEGDRVTQGQIIATSGNKVHTEEPMLYFGMREKGISINPSDKVRLNSSQGLNSSES